MIIQCFDILENFIKKFIHLSLIQKKIWQYLYWCNKKFHSVFVSQERIAKFVGCTRQTVNRTLKFFQSLGWLIIQKRCWRSSIYILNSSISAIDTMVKKNLEKSPDLTSEYTRDFTCNVTVVKVAKEEEKNDDGKGGKMDHDFKNSKDSNSHESHASKEREKVACENMGIKEKTCQNNKLSRDEVYFRANKSYKDWSVDEIESAFERYCNAQ